MTQPASDHQVELLSLVDICLDAMTQPAPDQQVELQSLVDIYARASFQAFGHPTCTHAGIAAVLKALSNVAFGRACEERSLTEFAASLHYAAKGSERCS